MKIQLLSGTGNNFLVVDNRTNAVKNPSAFACSHSKKYKTDGVILIETSSTADFKMRILNPDGSEAETCGNGLRCAAFFVWANKILSKRIMRIETNAGESLARIINSHTIRVKLPKPKGLKLNINLNSFWLNFINTGVPHAVIFVDDIENTEVFKLGRMIRNNDYFKPYGTNVDFVKVLDSHKIKIRTYERGVENETQACGTGAVASCLVAFKHNLVRSPVKVIVKSGEILTVYFDKNFKNIFLEGSVTPII